jgi:hypothetical protein
MLGSTSGLEAISHRLWTEMKRLRITIFAFKTFTVSLYQSTLYY